MKKEEEFLIEELKIGNLGGGGGGGCKMKKEEFLNCNIILQVSEYLFPPAYNMLSSADVLVEFDDTNYTAIEGEDVIFRVVKRTDSNREVTVVFNTRSNTRPGSASGEGKREL